MAATNPRARFLGPVRRNAVAAPDDLLTAGLGLEGLRGPAPGFADALQPTPAELRRRSIHANYRSLQDVTDLGGYGRCFGLLSGQRCSGVEYLGALAGPEGQGRHTVCLLIPENFNVRQPVLVAAAASGSRGVYGGLPIAGPWALARGYALVLTDKGTGSGLFDVDTGTGIRIDGTLTTDRDDPWGMFIPKVDDAGLAPHSVLFRHPQGGVNPERLWGDYLLQAIDAALQWLRQEYTVGTAAHAFAPSAVRILATGISNGGATVLRALERDAERWISGAAVSEPNVIVAGRTAGLVVSSEGRDLAAPGRTLFDYGTEHFLWQPAALAHGLPDDAPFAKAMAAAAPALQQWCGALAALGLLPQATLSAQAADAREQLLAGGARSEALELGGFNMGGFVWPGMSYAYTMAYAQLLPGELPFGVRFAATDAAGQPRALQGAELARAWCDASGLAPTLGIDALAPGADGSGEVNVNGGTVELALQFRALATGVQLPMTSTANDATPAGAAGLLRARVQEGLQAATMTGCLNDRPVAIVHGRADALIQVNHSSRAYYALARSQGATGLRYYEVQHAQHFDGYLGLPGMGERYVPLNAWLERALTLVDANLQQGEALPVSQVVRSSPRGAGLPALKEAHLGRLAADPGADAVLFDSVRLTVPE
jgi:hydroxybutyrate-dimer hydrolase